MTMAPNYSEVNSQNFCSARQSYDTVQFQQKAEKCFRVHAVKTYTLCVRFFKTQDSISGFLRTSLLVVTLGWGTTGAKQVKQGDLGQEDNFIEKLSALSATFCTIH